MQLKVKKMQRCAQSRHYVTQRNEAMQVPLRCSASKLKQVLFFLFTTKTAANLALQYGLCVAEFFTQCLINYVRVCVALPIAGNRALQTFCPVVKWIIRGGALYIKV